MFNPQGYSYMIIDTSVNTLWNSSDNRIKTETVSMSESCKNNNNAKESIVRM